MAYKRIIRTDNQTDLLSWAMNDLTIRPVRRGFIGEYVLESPSGLERQLIDKLVKLFDADEQRSAK